MPTLKTRRYPSVGPSAPRASRKQSKSSRTQRRIMHVDMFRCVGRALLMIPVNVTNVD
jgi:hypothetical protein